MTHLVDLVILGFRVCIMAKTIDELKKRTKIVAQNIQLVVSMDESIIQW